MFALAVSADPQLSWDLLDNARQLFEYPYMVNAFRAGTIVALTAGAIGWFMVLRRQSFAGHTLALVGFPGAAGAVLLGYSASLGFFAFCMAAALIIASGPGRSRRGANEESAVVATVQSFALACGYLFVSMYRGNLNGITDLLFGDFLGITESQVVVLAWVATALLLLLVMAGRPLYFASIDPDVASARGVPVGVLSFGFLLLLGVAAAAVSQITGSLLVFALLVLPAATAQSITLRPAYAISFTVALGVAVTWLGLAFAYFSSFPIGFWITTFAFGTYVATRVGSSITKRRRSGRTRTAGPTGTKVRPS